MESIDTLSADDLGPLTALVARALDRDELPAPLLRGKLFADPDHSPHYSLGVRQGGRLLGAAIGVLRRRADGPAGYVRLIATDPAHRRRGIASALLAELERRLLEDGATSIDVGAEVPVFLFPGVEVSYTAALCFLERRGYARRGDTSNLEIDLVAGDFDSSRLEAALAEGGILVRRLQPDDRPAFDDYLAANWGETWRLEGLSALEASPPTCFVAIRRGQIVGFAVYDVSRPGWFGPTGTDEALRGRGIGTVLLYRCLQEWQRAGRRAGEICWIGPLRFYSTAANARVCRVYWQMRKGGP